MSCKGRSLGRREESSDQHAAGWLELSRVNTASVAWILSGGDKNDDDLLAKSLVNQAFLEHDFVLEIRIISLK